MAHMTIKAREVKLYDRTGTYEVVKLDSFKESVYIWFERIGLNRKPEEINADGYNTGAVDGFYEALSPSDDVQVFRPDAKFIGERWPNHAE